MGLCASSSSASSNPYAAGAASPTSRDSEARMELPPYSTPSTARTGPSLPLDNRGTIKSIASGPEMTFVCGDEEGRVAWYDMSSRSLLHGWKAHRRPVNAVACSGGQRRMCVAASRDLSLSLWDLSLEGSPKAHEACRKPGAHSLNVSCCDISEDASLVVSASKDTTVCAWDVESGLSRLAKQKPARNTATCLALFPGSSSSSGALVAQGAEDLRVRLWDLRTLSSSSSAVLTLHSALEGYVYFPLAVDVHEHGRYVLTSSRGVGGLGGEARVWDVRMPAEPVVVEGAVSEPSLPPLDFEADWGLTEARGPGVRVGEYEGHSSDAVSSKWVPEAVCESAGLPSGSFVTASTDCTVRLWSVKEGSDGHVRSAETGESAECMSRYVDPDTRFSALGWVGMSDTLIAASHGGGYSVLRPVDGMLRLAARSDRGSDGEEEDEEEIEELRRGDGVTSSGSHAGVSV